MLKVVGVTRRDYTRRDYTRRDYTRRDYIRFDYTRCDYARRDYTGRDALMYARRALWAVRLYASVFRKKSSLVLCL